MTEIFEKLNMLLDMPDVWEKISADPRPKIVYGMGNGADKLFLRLDSLGVKVSDVMASDGFVRGQVFHGFRVKSFAEIKETYPDFLIIVAFASRLPDVMNMLIDMAEHHSVLMPDMPVTGENYFTSAFYRDNFEKIKKAAELLADDKSKETYLSILSYKLTGEISYLRKATVDKDGLYEALPCKKIKTVLDLGAYNGDTVREAEAYFENLTEVVAVEPDPKTFKRLLKYCDTVQSFKITPVNAAVYSGQGSAVFHASGNRNSGLISSSFEHKDGTVPTVTPDSLCENFHPDFIKYDVEGAEREALFGSESTIKRDRPYLLVSVYHRSEDIFSLPLYLSETYPDYRFTLRRISCFPAWEADLLALPIEKTTNL